MFSRCKTGIAPPPYHLTILPPVYISLPLPYMVMLQDFSQKFKGF